MVTGGSGSGKFKLVKVHACCTLSKVRHLGRFVTLYAFGHLKVLFGVCTVANNILNNFLHGSLFQYNRLNSGYLYRKMCMSRWLEFSEIDVDVFAFPLRAPNEGVWGPISAPNSILGR